MRLRPLTEAECYARCYGGHSDERVSVVRLPARASRSRMLTGESLRARFERELDARAEAEAA
jgi:hypothetical protein